MNEKYEMNLNGPTGVEFVDATIDGTEKFGKSARGRAAKCDALGPALQEVVATWDRLPDAINTGIIALVKATVGCDT